MLLQFDYEPVLELEIENDAIVYGLAPTHAALAFIDTDGNRFTANCPPALVRISRSESDPKDWTAMGWARDNATEVLNRVLYFFRYRPLTVLRGMYLATRGHEPPPEITYLRRLAVVLEKGQPRGVTAARLCDAANEIRTKIEMSKHFNDVALLRNIEKGIRILREALERDAGSAIAALAGRPRDLEQERLDVNGNNVQTPFGFNSTMVNVNALLPSKYGQGMIELTDDIMDGMIG